MPPRTPHHLKTPHRVSSWTLDPADVRASVRSASKFDAHEEAVRRRFEGTVRRGQHRAPAATCRPRLHRGAPSGSSRPPSPRARVLLTVRCDRRLQLIEERARLKTRLDTLESEHQTLLGNVRRLQQSILTMQVIGRAQLRRTPTNSPLR